MVLSAAAVTLSAGVVALSAGVVTLSAAGIRGASPDVIPVESSLGADERTTPRLSPAAGPAPSPSVGPSSSLASAIGPPAWMAIASPTEYRVSMLPANMAKRSESPYTWCAPETASPAPPPYAHTSFTSRSSSSTSILSARTSNLSPTA